MEAKVKSLAEQEALWDARDVAAYLKVSRSWVYQRVERGELPCRRIGGLVRFDPAAIRAWATGAPAPAAAAGARVIPFGGAGGGTMGRGGEG